MGRALVATTIPAGTFFHVQDKALGAGVWPLLYASDLLFKTESQVLDLPVAPDGRPSTFASS